MAPFKRFLRVLGFSILLLSPSAFAQAKGYIGGFGGMSVPDADHTSARPMFGILGGARLDGELGLGGFFLSSSKEESNNGVKFDFDYNVYGFDGTWHLEGIADGAYLSGRLGLAKVSVGNYEYSPMVWGLGFGYDRFFSENFSAGVEAGFMSVESGDDTQAGIKQDFDSFTMINFAATAKFWF